MQNWGETRVGFGATIAPSDDWLNPSLNVDAANDGETLESHPILLPVPTHLLSLIAAKLH